MEQIILFLEKRLKVLKQLQTELIEKNNRSDAENISLQHYFFCIQEIKYILYHIKNDEIDIAKKELQEHLNSVK